VAIDSVVKQIWDLDGEKGASNDENNRCELWKGTRLARYMYYIEQCCQDTRRGLAATRESENSLYGNRLAWCKIASKASTQVCSYCTISTDCSVTRHCDCELNNSGVSSRVTGGREQLHKQVIKSSITAIFRVHSFWAPSQQPIWHVLHIKGGKEGAKARERLLFSTFYGVVPWMSSFALAMCAFCNGSLK